MGQVIYDARGNRVKKLADDQPMKFGKHKIKWDGIKENGQKAEAGMYYVTLNYLDKNLPEKFYKLK